MKTTSIVIFFITGILLMVACKKDETEQNNTNNILHDTTPYALNYAGFPAPPIAQDNPLTVQGVKLGRMLFYKKCFRETTPNLVDRAICNNLALQILQNSR
jgi:hypothetical protein